MNKLPNTQRITSITMNPKAYAICDIGGDMYCSDLTIYFTPHDCYPDYMEVADWIAKNIDGTRLNIEDVVEKVYNFLMEEYKPLELEVVNNIMGCRTHFDVTVSKK